MSLVRWDPLRMRWPSVWDWDEDEFVPGSSSDNLDVYETPEEVVVRAHVPGVAEENIDVTFEKGVLWIRAESVDEQEAERKYYRKASYSYSYKVVVPGNLSTTDEPTATISDGVVSVTFKKADEAKPKKIELQRG